MGKILKNLGLVLVEVEVGNIALRERERTGSCRAKFMAREAIWREKSKEVS
jgi:hypothetical protein